MRATLGMGIAAVMLCIGVGYAKRHYPTHVYQFTEQHNAYEVGVTCTNGGDPTVVGNYDGMLLISCGK